jgi:regulatory protein
MPRRSDCDPSTEAGAEPGGRKPKQRARIAVSSASLGEAALSYLNRRDASREKLVKHLEQWIRRRGTPEDPREARPLIQELASRYQASGLINDDRLAKNALESLRARGASSRAIAFKLKARGVDASVIDSTLATEKRESRSAELDAACALVKKKRMGSLRPEAERAVNQRRDLAALARAGFDFDTARRALGPALDSDSDDEL